jgi:hypothetical protein
MKKVIWLGIVILGGIAAVLFGYQYKINENINNEISLLNSSGFIVKHEQSTNYIKTSAIGELEVIEPDKAATLFFSYIKDEDVRKNFENKYNTLALEQKELLFKGINLIMILLLKILLAK